MSSRVVFVGWDGADWDILDPLISELPNLAALRRSGHAGTLRSTFPPHSVAAWTSFLTGAPGPGHRILDFRACLPGSYFPAVPYSADSIPRPDLLQVLSSQGCRVLSVNLPMTYPPSGGQGVMVSGVFVPNDVRFTDPPELQAQLEQLGGFPINGLDWIHAESLDALYREALDLLHQRANVMRKLVSSAEWDVTLLGFMAPDRLQHVSMQLLDPRHPGARRWPHAERLRERLVDIYRLLDRALGEVIEEARAESVLLASDHGFRPVWVDVSPNELLSSWGMLEYRRGRTWARRKLTRLRGLVAASPVADLARATLGLEGRIHWERTRAYTPSGPSLGIRLNVLGRDPHGVIPTSRMEENLEEIRERLLSTSLPEGGPAFARVMPAAEVLGGPPLTPGVPDLFYEPAEGVGISMAAGSQFRPSGRKTGEHREDGIVVLHGAEPNAVPSAIWEVPRVLLQMAGIDETFLTASGSQQAGETRLRPNEEEEISKHLRGLGYVE